MLEFEDEPATRANGPLPKKKRRRILVAALVFLFVFLPLGGLFLNGPGFRSLARYGGLKAVAGQGLAGDFRVEGTLWSGFRVVGVELSDGTDDGISIVIEDVLVDYRLGNLISAPTKLAWLDALRIGKAEIRLVLPDLDESPAAKEELAQRKAPTDFSPIWSLLAADLHIEDLTLSIQQGDRITSFESLHFSLPGEGEGSLRIGTLALPGQSPLEAIDAVLQRGERELTLGPIPLLGYATVEALGLAEPEPGNWHIDASVEAGGGGLEVRFRSPGKVALNLRRGASVDLAKLPADAPSELRGSITDLALNFEGDFAKPASWTIDGKLVASEVGWGRHAVDSVLLLIDGGDLSLEAARERATLRLTASVPFENAEATADLKALPTDFGLVLAVPSLTNLLATMENAPPLGGSVSLELRDGQWSGGRLRTGNLLLQTGELHWNEVALPDGQVAARVERENFLRLGADFALDDSNHLRLEAGFDTEALSYEGTADLALDTAGQLGVILADLGNEAVSGSSKLDWKGVGELREARHEGSLTVSLDSLALGSGHPLGGGFEASYGEGKATLERFTLNAGDVALGGTAIWDWERLVLPDWQITRGGRTPLSLRVGLPLKPGTEGGFLAQTGPVSLELDLDGLAFEEISRFWSDAPPLDGTFEGSVRAEGTFAATELDGEVKFVALPAEESSATDSRSLVAASFGLHGDLRAPASWEARLDAALSGLRFQEVALESLSLNATTDPSAPDRPFVAALRFEQAGTTLDARARLELGKAPTLSNLADLPLQLDATLAVAAVEKLLQDLAPEKWKSFPLAGSLDARVEDLVLHRGSFVDGTLSLASEELAIESEKFASFAIDADFPEADRLVASVDLGLDPLNQLQGGGEVHWRERTYEGHLELAADLVSKESALRRILGGTRLGDLLPKTTRIDWEGDGDLGRNGHRGRLSLDAAGLTLADGAEPISLKLAGDYHDTSAQFPEIALRSRPLDLDASLGWDGKTLLLSGKGLSSGREVLALDASVPLSADRLDAVSWFGQEEPLSLTLKIADYRLETFTRLFHAKSPVQGALSLALAASGSPAKPALNSELALDGISVPREGGELAAGRLDLKISAPEETLSIEGDYHHPDVKPLAIRASLPFHPAAWAKDERQFKEEKLEASAKMERSSLDFLVGQVPGIESITGEIALDAAVSGSLAAPEIRGSGMLDVARLRLEDRNAPSLRDIELVARFEENRVVLERLRAIVAGGIVEGTGEARFQPGGEPELRLDLTGSEVLVVRTDDVNMRTDLALSLAGPWSRASLSGEFGITNSRYFKNFDLMPFAFPTRRTDSVLPTVERTPGRGGPAMPDLEIGVPLAPFRDWPVSLRVYTKDPFLVQSNLAQSSIVADLRLVGTLGRPNPIGSISIDEGRLRLPFSQIDVETGRIEFDEATGFNGALEFKAKGKADRYQIAIYLHDRVLTPKYVLTSIPPLPSEDIMTLLATGTTRNELVGEDAGSVAATKAATLLFRNLQQANDRANEDPTLLDLLEERTELELGRVNKETGEQTFGGKIRLWRQLFFAGDVDADSNYRALFKYVFSFD